MAAARECLRSTNRRRRRFQNVQQVRHPSSTDAPSRSQSTLPFERFDAGRRRRSKNHHSTAVRARGCQAGAVDREAVVALPRFRFVWPA